MVDLYHYYSKNKTIRIFTVECTAYRHEINKHALAYFPRTYIRMYTPVTYAHAHNNSAPMSHTFCPTATSLILRAFRYWS